MTLVIDNIGGNCPVQAEGTICGKPFYFRARGETWQLGIADLPAFAVEASMGGEGWRCECSWGTEPFAAGWMPLEEARRLIEWCAGEYQRQIETAAGEASEAQEKGK